VKNHRTSGCHVVSSGSCPGILAHGPSRRDSTGLALVAVCVLAGFRPTFAAEPVAIFHVGNSLTDQAYGMHDIAQARGHKTTFGRHMIPGAPLDWLWNHRGEGFRQPGKEPADAILRENKWDVLILQPYGRAPEVSVKYGTLYAAEALRGNPRCRVYVFANYPGIGKDRSEIDQWEARWLSDTYTRGRANFEKVARGISEKLSDAPPVRIIPVGEVMYRLHQRMKSGKIPGYGHIAELFEDGVHLKSEGKYVEAVTHFATVFEEDPHDCITSGLRFWRGPYSVDKQFAKIVWDVVWEVVSKKIARKKEATDPMPHFRCITTALAAGLVLISPAAAGEPAPAEGEVISIDRPGVLDQPGATYRLTADVTAPRTAFMVKGDGITLDLDGHTITYGTEIGVDYCHAV